MSVPVEFGLAEVIAAALVLALNAYAVTGGADFGGGVWDLLARGPRRNAQRRLIAHAIGPIWEANHVWLILAVVILFTAFPAAFATLGVVLHIPLSLMLLGVVLRGSSFVFRTYGARDDATQRRWSRVFASASIVTPLLLGIIVGALSSGAVGRADALLAARVATREAVPFAAVFIWPWLAPFPLAMGVLALAMFAFLAAVYLALAAPDDAVRDDFRQRALGAALVVFFAALGGLVLSSRQAPHVTRALLSGSALALQVAIGVAASSAIWALWTRRWQVARVAAVAQVSLIVWGWVAVQYPFMIPPTHAIRAVAAPRITLLLLLGALVVGSVVLVPSLVYLYRTFDDANRGDGVE